MASLMEILVDAMGTKSPEEIRNVCLIAHVDHGKTSFADSLLSTNAIISARMAGKLRFLDSREDEQTRGITMKTSGMSLLYGPMLVNLMDSPGHVDFSSEVSATLLLSDIALLLVDVVEGVCSQTQALLRQSVMYGQTVILVINKLDRLRVELKMETKEAYAHIVHLLEAINSCVSQVVQCLALEDDSVESIEDLEASLHFSPTKGNVIFSSAIHGYAFGLEDFAAIYSEKLKIPKTELMEVLFGDFYISGGKIKSDAASRGRTPLFVQLVLEPLWALHDCGLVTSDLPKLLQLIGKIGLRIKSSRTPDAFDEAMRTWLPVSQACFRYQSSTEKPDTGMLPNRWPVNSGLTVALVVKFIAIEGQKFSVCRIFSGQVTVGEQLYVIGRRVNDSPAPKVTVDSVCALHGRDLIPLKVATAGVICAIKAQGLIQNATLCSEAVNEGLDVGMKYGEPLVRVSVSTVNLEDMERLRDGLKSLSILDSSLRVLELDNGELAMVTAGEVHLQKCLKDLEDLGFRDLEVEFIFVPFLETVVADTNLTLAQIQDQVTECRLRDSSLHIRLRVVPLPDEVVTLLEESADLLSIIKRGNSEETCLADFKSTLLSSCEKHLPQVRGSWWYRKSSSDIADMVDKIWSFGPDRARANILFNAVPNYERKSIWDKCEFGIRPLDQAMVAGFELFVSAGPLCHEVMRGVAVVVEEWTVDEEDIAVAGQLMTAMRSTCQAGAKKVSLRLVAAMYRCMVTTAVQALGKVHSVLGQRKGKVLNEDVNEATGQYEVTALIPVIETFSFCDHLRKSTSGMASAQLEFSHWQLIDEDPYWQPTTLEEMEEYGVKGDSPNHARGYMDAIRRRKGLPTDDVIVVSAEKQRNLKKNK
uniref:Elongation factor-like 1 n=1 Tax=Angiostrongylus cantonensis TaxID=6313 RepID=A0A0K0CZY3_ANGCA